MYSMFSDEGNQAVDDAIQILKKNLNEAWEAYKERIHKIGGEVFDTAVRSNRAWAISKVTNEFVLLTLKDPGAPCRPKDGIS